MKSKNLHVGHKGDSKDTSRQSHLRALTPALIWAAVLFGLSCIPGRRDAPALLPGADKLVHAVLFGILGALLARGLSRSTSLRFAALMLTSVGLAILYGASDEFHQAFVPGRSPDVLDLLADGAGATLGAAIALVTNAQRAKHARSVDP